MSLLGRIVLAVVVGVIVYLACLLVGIILVALGVPIVTTIGGFLQTYAVLFGALAGLWHFFAGSPQFWNRR